MDGRTGWLASWAAKNRLCNIHSLLCTFFFSGGREFGTACVGSALFSFSVSSDLMRVYIG